MKINAKTILILIGIAIVLYYLMRKDKPIRDQDKYDGSVGGVVVDSGLDEFMADDSYWPDNLDDWSPSWLKK
jgi:hypothetical protein|tara:strand:- start:27 stop:242 length:216 start_codon:yes stop_codon:yes gene_type:complete